MQVVVKMYIYMRNTSHNVLSYNITFLLAIDTRPFFHHPLTGGGFLLFEVPALWRRGSWDLLASAVCPQASFNIHKIERNGGYP